MSNFLYYQSVSYIPASLAIVILMQFTWISLLLDWLFYRVRPRKIELLTVLLILIGTVLASGIFEQEIQSFSWIGVAFALATSFTYASYIVANSRIKNENCMASEKYLDYDRFGDLYFYRQCQNYYNESAF
jgi:drug/metabolite transporter (DMT)-like permease